MAVCITASTILSCKSLPTEQVYQKKYFLGFIASPAKATDYNYLLLYKFQIFDSWVDSIFLSSAVFMAHQEVWWFYSCLLLDILPLADMHCSSVCKIHIH